MFLRSVTAVDGPAVGARMSLDVVDLDAEGPAGHSGDAALRWRRIGLMTSTT